MSKYTVQASSYMHSESVALRLNDTLWVSRALHDRLMGGERFELSVIDATGFFANELHMPLSEQTQHTAKTE